MQPATLAALAPLEASRVVEPAEDEALWIQMRGSEQIETAATAVSGGWNFQERASEAWAVHPSGLWLSCSRPPTAAVEACRLCQRVPSLSETSLVPPDRALLGCRRPGSWTLISLAGGAECSAQPATRGVRRARRQTPNVLKDLEPR
mmetsp:Transcript_133518/g.333279  ORF Transcript_133518/g.333279 Transcript_133518/m.333279 type:complete len:147 (+) Transcript_133518:603-1043(+)